MYMFDLIPFERRVARIPVYDPFRDFGDIVKLWSGTAVEGFKTDIREEEKAYILEADLPGFNKEDIKVELDKEYLTISAERKSETEEKDEKGGYIRRERSYGSFSRSFNVSAVDMNAVTAQYKDGVLKLTMPKKENKEPEARQLAIE